MSARICIGYDCRSWVTFTVKDATTEELETIEQLREDNGELVAALEKLETDGRLEYVSEDHDDYPIYFANEVNTSFIDWEVDDDTDPNAR